MSQGKAHAQPKSIIRPRRLKDFGAALGPQAITTSLYSIVDYTWALWKARARA